MYTYLQLIPAWYTTVYRQGMLVLGLGLISFLFLSGAAVVEANEWTGRTAVGNNDTWDEVAYGNGNFVAVGYGGNRVMTSPDGITWTARSPLGDNDTWLGVTYGKGLFVAVGSGGDYAMSSADNGATWTVRTAAQNNTWRDVTYSEELGLFVAVAFSGTDRVMTSVNGTSWTARTTPGDSDAWESVTYGNGHFVAVACGKSGTACNTTAGDGNRVMTSPDGITWTLRSTGLGADQWKSVTYGNGIFVAVSESDDKIATSPDGITWTSRGGNLTSATPLSVTYGAGKFVMVGYCEDNLHTCTAESTDGINWVAIPPPAQDGGWIGLAYGEDTFVAVNYGFGTTTGSVMTLPATTSLAQSAFRYVTDDGSESASSFAMNLNNDIVWGVNTPVRFRAQVNSSLATASRDHYYLQYKATTSDFWHTVGVDDPAPQIVATSSGRSTGDLTTHSVTIPAGNVEDLLLVIFSNDSDALSTTTSPGWYKFGEDSQHNVSNANAANVSQSVFWKRATTTTSETVSITPTGSGAEEASYVVYRLSGAGVPVFDSARSGSGNSPVPSLTTDAIRSYLWIAGRAHNGASSATAAPANFGQMISIIANTANGASTDTAIRYERATTTSPGTFTNATGQTLGTLIAVPPRETPTVGNVFLAEDDRVPSAVNDTGIGTLAWSSLANITASDNAQVSRTMSGTAVTNYIKATGFGFAVPDEAEIVGIEAFWEKSYGVVTTGRVVDDEVVLVKNGTVIGDDKSEADAWATQGVISTYGGPGDLWGTTWTPADINDSDFGAAIAGRGIAGTDGTARVDYVEMKVYYRLSPDIILTTSASIGASGANTTARLTPPSGKTTSDFDAGRIQDDENPSDQINISANDYTEVEWSIMATGTATTSDIFNLRVALGPHATLTSYATDAALTIGTYVPDDPEVTSDTMLLSGSVFDTDMSTLLSTATRTVRAVVHDDTLTSFSTTTSNGEWNLAVQTTRADGQQWVGYDGLGNNDEWEAITYGEGVFVAVGNCSTSSHCVMTSADGTTWTARTAAEANRWRSVTYGSGLFVAVADTGTNRVMTSADGTTWIARSVPASGWRSVTYGNGRFVAVGQSGVVMTSTDGTSWSSGTAAESNFWEGVTYGKGVFVAVASDGTNRVMTSTNGTSWTSRSAAAVKFWRRVTYGNGRFVATASDSAANVMYSNDGLTWFAGSNESLTGNWFGLTYGNGLFVAVSYSTDKVITSPDGVGWAVQTIPGNVPLELIGYGAGRFVALADSGPSATTSDLSFVSEAIASPIVPVTVWIDGDPEIHGATILHANRGATSTAGIDIVRNQLRIKYDAFVTVPVDLYTLATYDSEQDDELPFTASTTLDRLTTLPGTELYIEAGASLRLPGTTYLGGNLYNAGTLYSAPTDTLLLEGETNALSGALTGTSSLGRVVASSTIFRNDAVTWVARSAAQANEWRAVAYGNGLFVAVSVNGVNHVMTSPDGITWTPRAAAGDDDSWNDVVYGGGQFVAVGESGDYVMTSPDGITWTAQAGALTGPWQSVAYGNGLYVATKVIAGSDRIMTSPDAITWTSRSIPALVSLYNVTYGNGRFVAIADATNGSRVSTNGTTWTAHAILGSEDDWHALTYGNGLFVAVGDCSAGDCIATSPDGVTWTTRTAPSSQLWDAITYGNGLFVALARNATAIMTSPDGITWTLRTGTAANSWADIIYGNEQFVGVSRTGTNRVMTSTTGTTSPGVVTLATTTTVTDLTIATGTLVAADTLTFNGSYENNGTSFITSELLATGAAGAFMIASSTVDDSGVSTFSVATADTLPGDMVFHPEGTMLYVAGDTNNHISVYTLPTPWDVSTAQLENYTLYVGDLESTLRSLQWSADGRQLFVIGIANDTIYRFTLTSAWDIRTASYSGVSLSIAAQEGGVQVMRFSPDGMKLYITGTFGDDINQYSLAAPWDITAASYDGLPFDLAADEENPQGILFHPDGQLLFVIGSNRNRIDTYTLSIPWDTRTATTTTNSYSVASYETNSQTIQFSADGRFLYLLGQAGDDITVFPLRAANQALRGSMTGASALTNVSYTGDAELTLMEATELRDVTISDSAGTVRVHDGVPMTLHGDITNAGVLEAPTTPLSVGPGTGFAVTGGATLGSPFSVSGQDITPWSLHFKPDGTKLFMVGLAQNYVYSYTLTTAWDVSTASYDSAFVWVGPQDSLPLDVDLSTDGTKMYIVGQGNGNLVSYTLRVPWDVSTTQYDNYGFSVLDQETSVSSISFKPDGTLLYLVGSDTDRIRTYALGRPWDLTTASYTGDSKLISSETTNPQGLSVTPDGQHAYVVGGTNVYYYTFTTPWDVTSLTYQQTLSVSGADTVPRAVAVNPTGTRLYLVGDTGNDITTFSLPEQSQTISTTGTGRTRFGDTTISNTATTTISGVASTTNLTIATSSTLVAEGALTIGGQYQNNGTVDFSLGTQVFTPLFGSYTFTDATLTLVDELDLFESEVVTSAGQKIFFSPDGETMYHLDTTTGITPFRLGTPWYPSTATPVGGKLSLLGVETDPQALQFRPDGQELYVLGNTGDDITVFALVEPWNVLSAQFSGTRSLQGSASDPQEFIFRPDGTYMYVLNSPTTDTLVEYRLLEAWNIFSASSTGVSLSVNAQDSTARGIHFSSDGRYLYLLGIDNDRLYRYTLSTPWNLSTAVVDTPNHYTGTSETFPQGIRFIPDQTAYITHGTENNRIVRFDVFPDTQVASGTLSGAGAFNNLVVQNNAANTSTSGVSFLAPLETTGTFTLDPDSYTTLLANATNTFAAIDWSGSTLDTRAVMRSSAPTASTTIVADQYVSVGYLDVRDVNNASSSTIFCLTGCVDSGNNTNWTFEIASTSAALTQTAFRFVGDTAAESTAAFLMSKNTDISFATSSPLRLRAQIDNSDESATTAFALQYKPTGNTAWHTIGVDDSYPTIVATSSGRSTGNATSHPITIPSGNPGDLLIVIMGINEIPRATTVASEWKRLHAITSSGSLSTAMFYTFATTSSQTLTVTLEQTQEASYVVYRIAGAGTPVADAFYADATNSNPPLVTVDAARPHLLIAARVANGQNLSSARPTGYQDPVQINANTSGGASTEAAHRFATVASEDPSNFTSATTRNHAITIMVPPAYTPTTDQLYVAISNSPGTAANDASFGSRAWTTPNNALGSDNSLTYFTAAGTASSNHLKLTNFGFTIPAEATITGVEVWFERRVSAGTSDSIRDDRVRLVKNNTVTGTDQLTTFFWTFEDEQYVYGGPTNLWGTTLTPADVNATNFGFVLSARGTAAGADRRGNIDNASAYVYYTMPAPVALAPSTYIGAGGESTTARLSPPTGRTTGDFVAGRIQDDENPADAITLPFGSYTEYEWNIVATSTATTDDVFDLRVVTSPGLAPLTYDHEPQVTIGTYQADGADWNGTDWTERETLVIDHVNIDATLTDFPVYVDLSDLSPDFWAGVSANCGDIRVTNQSFVELPREVVACNTSTDTGELHFRADTLSATLNTVFYIYYNGTDIDYGEAQPYGSQNVWTNDYVFVHHLSDGDSTAANFYQDSTANDFDGTLTDANGNTTEATTGRVGNAVNFSGDADQIVLSGFISPTSGTVSAWIKRDVVGVLQRVMGIDDSYEFKVTNTNLLSYNLYHSGTSVAETTQTAGTVGNWYYMTGSYTDGGTIQGYYNGSPEGSGTSNGTNPSGSLSIGARNNLASQFFDGVIDEVRISSTTRTAAWIKAEYYNQATTTDFYSFGESATGTIAVHSDGRISNTFNHQNKTDEPVYSFRVTPSVAETVDQVVISVTGIKGIETGELADFRLYRDTNSDNLLDGGDTQVGGAGVFAFSGQAGTVTFSTDFALTTATDFIVTTDITSIDKNDVLVFSLRSSGLIATDDVVGLPVIVSGTVPTVQHSRSLQGNSGGGNAGSVGGEAPAGDGDVGGGEEGGGGEIGAPEDDGENISPDPNFRAPSSTGDPNNQWTNPENAYVSDGQYATSSDTFVQSYGGFGFTIPGSNVITGIEVKVDMRAYNLFDSGYNLQLSLSQNGGNSFTTEKVIPQFEIALTDQVFTLGSSADLWGTTWNPNSFSNGNFRVRVRADHPGATSLYVDAIEVRVYHQATGGGGGGGGGAI